MTAKELEIEMKKMEDGIADIDLLIERAKRMKFLIQHFDGTKVERAVIKESWADVRQSFLDIKVKIPSTF